MKIASPTPDEQARLKALYDYDVLDTEAEKIFDDLTQLAAQICGMPITLISLVDPDRQWFKSKVGLAAEETSRDIAFCAHAIHQAEIFEVEDTLKDQRFFDNPLVTSAPNIRFYAGTPLVTPEGYAIGTLCVIDEKPNKLTKEQRQALEVLGRSVISQMELRKNLKRLKTANQHKTDFLSNMSHELRTPLNAIIGFSQLLLDEIKHHDLPDKFLQYLNHLDYSGKRLLTVINSVIDLNRIESGKMQLLLESVNIRQLIDELLGMLSIMAAEKNISLSVNVSESMPESITTDQDKIKQIVTNLVHNAIKFTPSGGWVKTEFSQQSEQILVTVADNGVGITNEDQEKLFNKFQQVGQTKGGSGLGLSITQGLTTLLGGKINVLSKIDNGSIFRVSLPVIQSSITKQKNVEQPFVDEQFDPSANILLVEDNDINQAVMSAMFLSLNMTITIADSGEVALQLIGENTFDLILMDSHLPNLSGRQTSEKIRALYPELPIVAVSADTFNPHQYTKDDHIWQEYLCKPLEKERLIQTLNRFIPFRPA